MNDIFWHYRLGHVPFSKMKDISVLKPFLSTKQSFPCPVCPLARQTRLSFSDSSIHSTAPFQLIHIDTWGPYHSPIHNRSRYFLTIVDDFYRVTWTHLMGAKRNAFDLLKAFISMVETQFSSKVLTVRNDNAFELGSSSSGSAYFSQKGIIHQTTFPHTPQQNGVIESKHRHLLETAKSLLFQYSLPIQFWGDFVLIATYLINIFPSNILHKKSPFEVLHSKAPSYSHLKAFGCLRYSSVSFVHRDKFKPRAIPCIFIGYPFDKKGYKLYNICFKTSFVSRDAVFHEHIFPFVSHTGSSLPLQFFLQLTMMPFLSLLLHLLLLLFLMTSLFLHLLLLFCLLLILLLLLYLLLLLLLLLLPLYPLYYLF